MFVLVIVLAKDLGEGLHVCERQRTLLSFGQSRGTSIWSFKRLDRESRISSWPKRA